MRTSGILLPITSLPSKYGVGTLGKSAYDFIDFLEEAGQTYWQILPLGPTGFGDSPYQSFSTFAGNPYMIDLEMLIEDGLLTEADCAGYNYGDNEEEVDYGRLHGCRYKVLRKAFEKAQPTLEKDEDYQLFMKENADWVKDYALFRAVKDYFGGKFWQLWPEDIKLRQPAGVKVYQMLLKQDIAFYCFLEYTFLKQYLKMKKYANKKGIQILGDIPIYVSIDSADAWAQPEMFYFDKDLVPTKVAGVPPDAFSETGQLWGNPLYDWEAHKKEDYAWWISRVRHSFKLFDLVRIDHFRGFDEYYAIPYGETTAMKGKWEPGPGIELFDALKKALGKELKVDKLPIVAEDLGVLTDSVYELLDATGYPGMKVLQFAFEGGPANVYLPYNHVKNSVVYTGTHDNDTLQGWKDSISDELKEHVMDFIGLEDEEGWNTALIRMALMSSCDTAIIPMQDYLELGTEARINEPSTTGMNWRWRLKQDWLEENPKLAKKICHLTEMYNRK